MWELLSTLEGSSGANRESGSVVFRPVRFEDPISTSRSVAQSGLRASRGFVGESEGDPGAAEGTVGAFDGTTVGLDHLLDDG